MVYMKQRDGFLFLNKKTRFLEKILGILHFVKYNNNNFTYVMTDNDNVAEKLIKLFPNAENLEKYVDK